MSKVLSAQQRLFVVSYIETRNATTAAKLAGYSEKTAYSQGSRLLNNAEIQSAIEEGVKALEAEALKRAAKRGITKERWLGELQLIAFSDMDDFAKVTGGDGEPIEIKLVPSATRRPRRSRVIKKINACTVELHDKMKALGVIGQHFGWTKQTIALQNPDGTPIKMVQELSDEELDQKFREMMARNAPKPD